MITAPKEIEHFTSQAQQVFGPGAKVTGSAGTAAAAGAVEISVDGQLIGTGPTFADALRHAAGTVSAGIAWWNSRTPDARRVMLEAVDDPTPARCWQVFGLGSVSRLARSTPARNSATSAA